MEEQVPQQLQDKPWRMNHLYKIVNKFSKLITFRPNPAQAHFEQNKHTKNIILKSRRIGFTTYSTLDMLDNTLFNKNFNALFVSYDEPSAKKVFDEIAMLAWGHFPIKDFYQVDLSNANMLKLNFGDNTYSTIEIKSTGRGGRYNQIHVSEFGKICAKYPHKATELLSGTLPALTPQGTLTIESTAEGETGNFHDMFWDAYERRNHVLQPHEYKAHFYNWQWDKEEIAQIKQPDAQLPKDFLDYQKKHNEKAKKFPEVFKPISDIELTFWFYKYVQLGRKWSLLKREYPTTPDEAFESSGNKLFDPQKLEAQRQFFKEPAITGDWCFYDDPRPNHNYVIGADPAEGVGGDHSAIVIWDMTLSQTIKKPRIVATYKNNFIPPDLLAFEIANQGRAYSYALAMVERNNTGHATLTQLKQIYPVDCIYKEEDERKEDTQQTQRLGWLTNMITKPRMFYEFSTAINEELVEIPSQAIISEARVYDRNELNTLKADDDTTNHYDLLTAAAIGFQGKHLTAQLSTPVTVVNPKQDIKNTTPKNPYAFI
jgi:hypothetical protein